MRSNIDRFYIEYRFKDEGGYWTSGHFDSFESAQAAREEYIKDGAIEALIKKEVK